LLRGTGQDDRRSAPSILLGGRTDHLVVDRPRWHTGGRGRSAVGMAELPLGMAVEIEAIAEIAD
jgi:hypothetical protein